MPFNSRPVEAIPKGAVPLPAELDTKPFRKAWAKWRAYLLEQWQQPLGTYREMELLRRCLELKHDRAIAAIEASIEHGWKSIYEERGPSKDGAGQARPSQEGISRVRAKAGKYDNLPVIRAGPDPDRGVDGGD